MQGKVSIDEPIQIRLEIDVRDDMFLYPDVATDNNYRDALRGGIKSRIIEFEDAGSFKLSIFHKDDQIVDCEGLYIDEWSEEYDANDGLSDIANEFDETAMQTFRALENWNEFVSVEEDDYESLPCCIYIDRLYVNPEYRGNGFASYVFNHISEIFKHKYGYSLRYACILVKPDDQNLMPEEEMKALMMKTLEKRDLYGFHVRMKSHMQNGSLNETF